MNYNTLLLFVAVLLLAGCGPRMTKAHIPGCLAEAQVVVPRNCYSIIFQNALEVRCQIPPVTVKYAECRKNPE